MNKKEDQGSNREEESVNDQSCNSGHAFQQRDCDHGKTSGKLTMKNVQITESDHAATNRESSYSVDPWRKYTLTIMSGNMILLSDKHVA